MNNDADAIIQSLALCEPGIIAIDGELGAGKSQLANEVAERTQIPVIHLDDFLTPGMDCYIDALIWQPLTEKVEAIGSPVILEGICLLDVLSKLNLSASHHFFLYRKHTHAYQKNSLVKEVEDYLKRNGIPGSAHAQNDVGAHESIGIAAMNDNGTNQLDVDIAYIRSKTLVAIVLAMGGMIALAVGAFVLTSGIETQDSAVFKILGAEISAEGIGAVILASSVLWAYFAYLARPKYSRRKEVRHETAADGSQNSYEFESSTMIVATPRKDSFA